MIPILDLADKESDTSLRRWRPNMSNMESKWSTSSDGYKH